MVPQPSCFGLFLLPGGLWHRFGSGASGAASSAASGAACASGASCSVGSIYYTWSRYAKPDNVAAQVGQPEAHVPQGDGAPEGHEVPVVGARLLVVRHHTDDLKDLLPPETKLWPSMWSTLKGFVGEAGGDQPDSGAVSRRV